MMARNRKPTPIKADDSEQIATPSLITPLHVQDRETTKVAGAPRAWRKMSIIEHCYQQLRLGALKSNDAMRRLDAGVLYTELWDRAQSAGRDSTAGFDAVRCMGSGLPVTEAQASAIQRLIRIEMHLGGNDRTIIRSVCALGYSPAEAMTRARLGNDTRVTARLCEALDCLAEACERTQKSSGAPRY